MPEDSGIYESQSNDKSTLDGDTRARNFARFEAPFGKIYPYGDEREFMQSLPGIGRKDEAAVR
jgi:hypothetical protein